MKYALTARGARNIRSIAHYIAKHDSGAALRFRASIMAACEVLGEQPLIGHTRDDLTRQSLRFWPVRHWLVVHRGRDPVEIVAVLDSRRDLISLLS